MGLFVNRPLAAVCFLFLVSLTACALLGAFFSLIFGAAALLFLLASLLYAALSRKWRRTALPLFCIASLLLGSSLGIFGLHLYAAKAEQYGDLRLTVEGEVRDTVKSEHATVFFLRVTKINEKAASGLLYVPFEGEEIPSFGDTVRFSASFSAPSEWEGAERYYRLSDGVFAEAELVTDLTVTEEASAPFSVISLRDRLSERLLNAAEGDAGALMNAMLLGRREFLSPTVARDFRRLGISHILCISGFHLALLAALALKLFRVIGLRRRASYAAMAVTVIAYAALIGFPVSVVRAGVMLLFIALSKILFRRADPLTSLAVAAALITLFSPHAVYDFGFWLSVVATFGILVYTEWKGMKKQGQTEQQPLWRRILSGTGESLAVTLCAIGATLPFTAIFFGELSLIAPLANLLLVPLLEGYLILSIPALVLGSSTLSPLFSLCGELILRAVAFFSDGRGILMSLDFLSVKILLFLLLFSLITILCVRRVTRAKTLAVLCPQAALVTIVFLSLHVFLFSQNALAYTVTGENEALVLYSEGKGMLCDCSSGGYDAERLASEQKERLRLCEYEAYLLTHYHEAHLDSTEAILTRTKVHVLYLPKPKSRQEEMLYRTLSDMAEKAGTKCVLYAEDVPISLGNLTFTPHRSIERNGHAEGAYTVKSTNARLTYLGGAYQREENRFKCVNAVAKSTHLILGRHGSLPSELIPYRRFSKNLALFLIPNLSRMPDALKHLLDEHNILYRTQEKWEYIPLD